MLAIRNNTPTFFTMDSFLDELFDFPTFGSTLAKCPIHDVIENDQEFIVEAMMAGIKKEDITIDVEKDVLTIKAERKEVKDIKYNRKESYSGKYQRSFVLPENVDAENISASMEDGVLKLTIPKKEVISEKKKIEIK